MMSASKDRWRFVAESRPTTIAAIVIVCAWVANLRWAPLPLIYSFYADDIFADFIKLMLSYPGAAVHPSALPGLIARYSVGHEADLSGLIFTNPGAAVYTHFHMPPMTTMLALLSRAAAEIMDPVLVFVAAALAVQAYTLAMPLKVGRDWREKLALSVVVAFAFSNVYMLVRGNLNAGLCSALLINSLVVLRKRPALAGTLLALACNIRPNAIVFALPVLALEWEAIERFGLALVITGLTVFGGFLVASHAFYPDYSFESFLTGLGIYNRTYVAGDGGMVGGSAIFSPFKLWLGYGPAALISFALAALFSLLAYLNRHGARSVIAFFACAAYVAVSVVLGDYYLTVFAVVPILAATDAKDWRVWLVTLTSALILAPVHYRNWGGFPDAIYLHPLLIVGTVFALAAASPAILRLHQFVK